MSKPRMEVFNASFSINNGEELKEDPSSLEIDIDNKEVIKYDIYRCVFKAVDDSLYIQIKNHETKRTFHNLFSKKVLLSMDFKQHAKVIVSLLNTAQSGNDSTISFAIKFGYVKEGTDNGSNNNDALRGKFKNGDSLYVCVDIKKEWHAANHIFQLIEQKRNETDKIYDIIADMKEERQTPAFAVYKRSAKPDTNLIALDLVPVAPTLHGMASLSDDKKYIVIGIESFYKITANYNWSTNDELQIHLNDNVQSSKFAGGTSGPGSTDAILKLKSGDKISFYLSCLHDTSAAYNSFVLKKL